MICRSRLAQTYLNITCQRNNKRIRTVGLCKLIYDTWQGCVQVNPKVMIGPFLVATRIVCREMVISRVFFALESRQIQQTSLAECHMTNYLLTYLARAAQGDIDLRSFSYGSRCGLFVLSRYRANIPRYFPRARLIRG